ncbi:MAG: twin-arginine translocase TatA/TatE family subunit [Pseudomonadota bacterium]|nr:twin-arginine translocase TatA/TatE family subunit [Pseudomonadota bacterium]
MGFMSGGHWIIILAIVMLLFGAKKLPDLGRSVGEAIRGFKKGLSEDEVDVTAKKKEIDDKNNS